MTGCVFPLSFGTLKSLVSSLFCAMRTFELMKTLESRPYLHATRNPANIALPKKSESNWLVNQTPSFVHIQKILTPVQLQAMRGPLKIRNPMTTSRVSKGNSRSTFSADNSNLERPEPGPQTPGGVEQTGLDLGTRSSTSSRFLCYVLKT